MTMFKVEKLVKLSKEGLNYKLIESLKPIAEELVKDAERGIAYWRNHRNYKCYACGVRGHIARDCTKICRHCNNIHASKLCIVAVQNWLKQIERNIEQALNANGLETAKQMQKRIAHNANIDHKVRLVNQAIDHTLDLYDHKLTIQKVATEEYRMVKIAPKPFSALKSVCQHTFSLQSSNILKGLQDQIPNLVEAELKAKQRYENFRNMSEETSNAYHEHTKKCVLCPIADRKMLIEAKITYLKENGYKLPFFGQEKYVKNVFNEHAKLLKTLHKNFIDHIHDGATKVQLSKEYNASSLKVLEAKAMLQGYFKAHAKPTFETCLRPAMVWSKGGRLEVSVRDYGSIVPSKISKLLGYKSDLIKQKQPTFNQKARNNLRAMLDKVKEARHTYNLLQKNINKDAAKLKNCEQKLKSAQNKLDTTFAARQKACGEIRAINNHIGKLKQAAQYSQAEMKKLKEQSSTNTLAKFIYDCRKEAEQDPHDKDAKLLKYVRETEQYDSESAQSQSDCESDYSNES